MKYFVRATSGIAMQIYRSNQKWSDDDYEITESQFANCVLPCKVEVTDNGIVFAALDSWGDVPVDEAVPGEPEPEPVAPAAVESDDINWDAMATAILEGVNDV